MVYCPFCKCTLPSLISSLLNSCCGFISYALIYHLSCLLVKSNLLVWIPLLSVHIMLIHLAFSICPKNFCYSHMVYSYRVTLTHCLMSQFQTSLVFLCSGILYWWMSAWLASLFIILRQGISSCKGQIFLNIIFLLNCYLICFNFDLFG